MTQFPLITILGIRTKCEILDDAKCLGCKKERPRGCGKLMKIEHGKRGVEKLGKSQLNEMRMEIKGEL